MKYFPDHLFPSCNFHNPVLLFSILPAMSGSCRRGLPFHPNPEFLHGDRQYKKLQLRKEFSIFFFLDQAVEHPPLSDLPLRSFRLLYTFEIRLNIYLYRDRRQLEPLPSPVQAASQSFRPFGKHGPDDHEAAAVHCRHLRNGQ